MNIEKIHSKNGRLIAEAQYINGKLNGYSKTWNEEGILTLHANHKDNEYHGIYKSWWPCGALKEVGEYNNGKKTGKYFWYKSNGELLQEHEY